MSGPHPTPADRLLAVIVLTQDEERTLPDCLTSLEGLEAAVWVVDLGSTDRTVEIAREAGCEVVHHPFETYAAQRNWAFDHLPIRSPWTLCLDADERLTAGLVAEIRAIVAAPEAAGPLGYVMSRRTIFMGRWIRHGGQYPTYHLRLFRTGQGRCEDRRYDQHFVVPGRSGRLRHDFIDVLTSDLTSWTARHNRWASLEADEQLRERVPATAEPRVEPRLLGDTIQRRRFWRSTVYRRTPLFVRPWLLWLYAYVVRLGFLDGLPGLIFHTLQKFWFRFLIDAKIYEAKRRGRG